MEHIPILKMGDSLLVSIQVDMHDRMALALQDDLTSRIVQTHARGVLIDISSLEIVDSFMGRMLGNISLMSRILASAAGLFGAHEAPRDPATLPLLLGLDGRRYLGFRSIVRAARNAGKISARDALSAYAFVIEARTTRNSIR